LTDALPLYFYSPRIHFNPTESEDRFSGVVKIVKIENIIKVGSPTGLAGNSLYGEFSRPDRTFHPSCEKAQIVTGPRPPKTPMRSRNSLLDISFFSIIAPLRKGGKFLLTLPINNARARYYPHLARKLSIIFQKTWYILPMTSGQVLS